MGFGVGDKIPMMRIMMPTVIQENAAPDPMDSLAPLVNLVKLVNPDCLDLTAKMESLVQPVVHLDRPELRVMRESEVSPVLTESAAQLASLVQWARLAHLESKGSKALPGHPVSPESQVVLVKPARLVLKVHVVKLDPRVFLAIPVKPVFLENPVQKVLLGLKVSRVTPVLLVPWDHVVVTEKMDFLVKLEQRVSLASTVKMELTESLDLPERLDPRDIREKLDLLVKVVSTVLMERLVLKELLVPKDPVVRPVQLVSVV